MKTTIIFESELEDLSFILDQLKRKITEQYNRIDGCICTSPEAADQIRDMNGNVVGTIKIKAPNVKTQRTIT
jgi:hypothetical protein